MLTSARIAVSSTIAKLTTPSWAACAENSDSFPVSAALASGTKFSNTKASTVLPSTESSGKADRKT